MDLVRLQMHIKRNVKPYYSYDCIVNNAQYIFIIYHSCNKLGCCKFDSDNCIIIIL